MSDTANHASTRRQARTDGGGGEKESSVPELCSLESVCGQACVYRHIARCVFTTIFYEPVSGYNNTMTMMTVHVSKMKDCRERCKREKSVTTTS